MEERKRRQKETERDRGRERENAREAGGETQRAGRRLEDRTAVYTLTFDLCITRVRNAESLFFAYPSIFSLCIFPLDFIFSL